jgi:hypothetical protein
LKGFMRAARYWLVLIACLAQLWMPAQHRHASFAAHAMELNSSGASSGLALPGIGAEKSDVRCSQLGAISNSHDGGAPAPPCQHDDCPCCPLVHAAIGILPQEAAWVVFAPLLSTTVAAPLLLGPLMRPVGFAGQPRAPPILI